MIFCRLLVEGKHEVFLILIFQGHSMEVAKNTSADVELKSATPGDGFQASELASAIAVTPGTYAELYL